MKNYVEAHSQIILFCKPFAIIFAYNYLNDENRIWNNVAGGYDKLLTSSAGSLIGEFKNSGAPIIKINFTFRL